MKLGDTVQITWVDAQSILEETDIELVKFQKLPVIKSVGVLLRNDRKMIALGQCITEEISTTLLLIPKQWQMKTKVLKKGKKA